MIKCLIELKWVQDAIQFIETFRVKFPKHSDSQALKTLEKRLEEVQNDLKEAETKQQRYKNRFHDNSDSDEDDDAMDQQNGKKTKRDALFLDEISKLKSSAIDFKLRFCGHCNTTTDIKEANFFGRYVIISPTQILREINVRGSRS